MAARKSEGDRMAHVRFADDASVDPALITAFVKEAVKLNREKGDPAKRAR